MKTQDSSRVLAIIDDDKSVLCALQDLVESEGMSALCFGSAEQFLDSCARHNAACLMADIRMPGMSGLELQAQLKAERSRMPIIFITGRGDIPSAVNAMKEGAWDFFAKPVNGTALLASIEKALRQNQANRQETCEYAQLVTKYKSLTPRERDLLPLLVSGLLNKQAASELGITEYTVQFHRGHIMRKMEADSFASLVRMADKLIPSDPQHLQPKSVHGVSGN
jgi:FixJ family two-component response regulator